MNFLSKIVELLSPAQRRDAVVLALAMLLGALLETLSVGLVVPVMTVMMKGDLGARYPPLHELLSATGASELDLVSLGVVLLVGVFLAKAVFLAWLVYRQAAFAFGLQADVSARLFRGYLLRPYTFHLQRNSAQLIRNAVNETNQFTFGAVLPGLVMMTEILVLAGIVALLIAFEPLGAVTIIAFGGAIGFVFHRMTRLRIQRWGEKRQVHEGLRIQHLQEGLGGVKEVKLLGREAYFLERYAVHNAASARTGELQTAMQSMPRLLLEFVAVLTLGIVVLAAQSAGRPTAELIPLFGLFSVAAFRLVPSINRVMAALQSIRFSYAVIDVLVRELRDCSGEQSATDSEPAVTFERELRLAGVKFTYPGADRPTLDNVDFTVRKGTTVGFVGGSGAGKSTLIDLILGLLSPDCGQLTVDGRDMACNRRGWQHQIGYVPQHIFLTDDTLRRNVAFGLPDELIDEARVCRAIAEAQLEEFVAGLRDGLDATVGEHGVRLSGGQRQRIGIARALYHRPSVLVLDEATSALDHDTERGVMEAVAKLHGTMTILIVAHRLTTVADCDVIFRVERSRVSQVGHEDLFGGGRSVAAGGAQR